MSKLPEGYTEQTQCCMRCTHMLDRSHPDSVNIYCSYNTIPIENPIYTRSYNKNEALVLEAWKWEVDHQVQPYGVCPMFKEKGTLNSRENDAGTALDE